MANQALSSASEVAVPTPNEAFHPIDAELYGHLVTGNVGGFHQVVLSKQLNVYQLQCSRERSTVLHIAASLGQVELLVDLLSHWPDLMVQANSKGDLAIHSALKAGRLNIVAALMTANCVQAGIPALGQVFGWKNGKGNTALHIALEYDEHEMAKHLVDRYAPACYLMNKKDVCPLYMAVTKELSDLVQLMLERMQPFAEEARSALKKGKSVLHAAGSADGAEFLDQLLKNYPELIDSLDEEGRTPLSYVAYMGDIVKVQHLLRIFPSSAFIRDEDQDGSFPIHQAVRGGYINVMEELTTSRFLLNAKGQNILHVAAHTGDSDVVTYLLRQQEVDSLINQKDENGNSPLHLATLAKHPSVVDIMIQDKRVKVGLLNKDGLTANDMVKKPTKPGPDDSAFRRLSSIFNRPTESRKNFPIDNELYGLLVSGDISQVNQIVSQKGLKLEDLECPQDKSTVLHVAAIVEQPLLIADVLENYDCGRLMFRANIDGDLPLHTAAKAGKLQSVQALLEKGQVQDSYLSFGTLRDRECNTTLHIALLNHQREMAYYLLHRCPVAAFCSNKDKICPLFLAIKDSYWDGLVYDMIDYLGDAKHQSLLKEAKSVVHAAICMRKDDILDKLLSKAPELINLFDTRGRSPLSYAAHMGYEKEVQLLLARYPALAFKRDKDVDGSFPIHLAAKGGHVKIIKLLYPTALLLNAKRRNILHVAAKAGSSDVVSHLLKMREFKDLINVSGQDGNTALHLAVQGLYPKIVYVLTLEEYINVNSINKDLWTADDLLRIHRQYPGQELHYRWAICASILKQVGGKKSYLPGREKKNTNKLAKPSPEQGSSSKSNRIRDRLNTLLLATTLIATVTFAAGFTLPGGYNQSNPDIGMATLAHRWAFQVFVICDTVAFFSSFVSAVMIVRGMHDTQDVELMNFCTDIGGLLLDGALIMMPMAFMSGVFVVLREQLWLGIVVLVVGFCSFLVILIARLLSEAPSFKSIRFRRYLFFLDRCYLLLLFYRERPRRLDSTI